MMTFAETMADWARLDEDRLSQPWTWRGGKMEARYALYRALEEAQEAVVGATAGLPSESRRILALAQRTFGDLRGLLIGLPDELLDKAPRPGEWPVRDVLRHVLWIERRYALQTEYAIQRGDADPVRIADTRLPALDQIDVSGDVAMVLARIAEARADTTRRLGEVEPAAMTRPTVWVHYDVDVRFRLHRFAAHVQEHTIQCEKTLAALSWRETEGRRIVRRIWSHVGELEGLGARDALANLERLVAEGRA
jgi:hypothetical protein